MTTKLTLEEITRECRVQRERSRRVAVQAIRDMEAALALALDGEILQGLPNLGPSSALAWRGARLRSKFLDRPLHIPPRGEAGTSSLCLSHRGRLAQVRVVDLDAGLQIEERPADDEDLHVDDVERLAETIVEVAREHMARVGRRAREYARIEEVARRLSAVLDDPETP